MQPAQQQLARDQSPPAPTSSTPSLDAARARSLYPDLARYVQARVAEFSTIADARRAQLDDFAAMLSSQLKDAKSPCLVFICTHNSRRSHTAQLWSIVAAEVYALNIRSYSGGTEVTAFNARAVDTLRRAGMHIEKTTDDANPIYHARIGEHLRPVTCYSKKYDNPPNPRDGFIAVMVCTDADGACPLVAGAEERVSLPYVDPKASDGTAGESQTYDERCVQIAREMLYTFSRVERSVR